MKQLITILLRLLTTYISAQSNLKIQNLLALPLISLSDLDSTLHKNNFEMQDSSQTDSTMQLVYKDKTLTSMIVINRNLNSDANLTYSFYGDQENQRLSDDLQEQKFKLITSDNIDGVIEKHYSRDDYTISIYRKFDKTSNGIMYMYSFTVKRDK